MISIMVWRRGECRVNHRTFMDEKRYDRSRLDSYYNFAGARVNHDRPENRGFRELWEHVLEVEGEPDLPDYSPEASWASPCGHVDAIRPIPATPSPKVRHSPVTPIAETDVWAFPAVQLHVVDEHVLITARPLRSTRPSAVDHGREARIGGDQQRLCGIRRRGISRTSGAGPTRSSPRTSHRWSG